MPEKNPVSARSSFGPVIIILLACCAVYFNSLFNGFVYDDNFQVLENPWIKDIRHLPEIFSTNVWSFRSGFSNNYRPLMHVIYMFNYHLFGLSSWGFHLVNILFHAGNSVLVFLLLTKLIRRKADKLAATRILSLSPPFLLSPAFIAALLFAVHPVHTEAVTWVAGLPELSFTLFFLLSFYLYILSREGLKGAYFFSSAAFSLATFCKEPALTLPAVLMAYDYAFTRDSLKKFSELKRYVPYLALAGLYLVMRYYALGGLTQAKTHRDLSSYQYFINIFPLFAQYIETLILPVGLNAFHVLRPITSIFDPGGMLSLAAAIGFAVTVFVASKKSGPAFVGLILLIVPLIPALYIPGLGENSFAERYLYLPSFGFILLIGQFVSRFSADTPGKAFAAALLFLVVAGLYSAGTISRNAVWKDDFSLWSDTAKKSPDAAVPHNELAYALLKQERVDEAIDEYQIALKLNPNYAEAYNNLGIAYARKGLPDKTIELVSRSLQLEPRDANAQYNLGLAYMQKGLAGKAIGYFEEAVRLAPADSAFRDALEQAYAIKKRKAEQESRTLPIVPDTPTP